MMSFVEKGGDFGNKGKGACDSATLRKSVDVKKERKRRLILQSSDSETDDYFISPRRKAEDCSHQNGDGPIVTKHDGAEQRKEAEIEGDKKQVMRLDNARSGSDKKRFLSGSGKKRNRELPGDEKLTKKIKTESLKDSSNGRVEGSCKKKLRSDSAQRGYKVHADGRERDGSKAKGRLVLNSASNSREEKIRRRDHTGNEKLPALKASNVVAIRVENDDIRRKGIRLQAKSGVLKVYPKKKKDDGVERVQFCQGDEEKSKGFESPSVAKSAVAFNQPDIYRERKSTERSDSSIKLGESRASLKKITPTGNSKANDKKVLQKAETDCSHQLEIEQENVKVRCYHKRPKVEKSRSFKLGCGMLPPGEWHCANCVCRFCGSVSSAAAPQLFSCSQCEKKYHQDCMPEVDSTSVPPNNASTSFCGQSCRMVYKQLKKLIGVKNDLEAGYSWRLIRRFDEDSLESLSGLSQRVECNSKIAVAFAVMDECFRSITDPRSGINLIHNVVYNCGSNINRLNYCGFYTFILERGDEIISAASISC